MSDADRAVETDLPDPRIPGYNCSVCGSLADGIDATREIPICRECAAMPPGDDRHHPNPDLSKLTPAERDAYEAVYYRGMAGREYARRTDRAWGTVAKLLSRAREKLDVHGGGE